MQDTFFSHFPFYSFPSLTTPLHLAFNQVKSLANGLGDFFQHVVAKVFSVCGLGAPGCSGEAAIAQVAVIWTLAAQQQAPVIIMCSVTPLLTAPIAAQIGEACGSWLLAEQWLERERKRKTRTSLHMNASTCTSLGTFVSCERKGGSQSNPWLIRQRQVGTTEKTSAGSSICTASGTFSAQHLTSHMHNVPANWVQMANVVFVAWPVTPNKF